MVQERRSPLTTKVAGMILAHKNDPNAHHVPGGVNIKGGIIAANIGANEHIFGTAFATVPRVTLEPMGTLVLRDCLHKLTVVSETGFSFEVDIAADYIWIATDAGDP